MFPFRKSLGFRLLLISVILLALPLLLDSFVLIERRYRDATNDAKNYLIEVANYREVPLLRIQPLSENFLAIMDEYLQITNVLPEVGNEEIEKKLQSFSALGDFYGTFLIKKQEDGEFVVINSNHKRYIGRNFTNFFKLVNLFASEDIYKSYTSRIAYDPLTLQPFFIVTKAIYGKEKREPIGYLVITDTANLSEKLEKLLAPDIENYPVNFALLLPSSIVFAASDPSLQFQYFRPLSERFKEIFLEEEPFGAALLPDKPIGIENVKDGFFEFTWEGDRQVAYLKQMPNADYALLTYASQEDIFADPILDFLDIYAIFALIIFVGTSLAYILIRRMARPINQLAAVMQKIQKGEIKERYSSDKWGFEINQLGSIFNNMLDSLMESKERTEKERVAKEGYARELKLGQQVQRSLLPREMPTYKGVDIAEVYIPAIEVGGDYFDLFVKEKGDKLFLAIADASGKGVQACFYSLGVRSLLRTYAKNSDRLDHAMHQTNKIFCEDVGISGMFITVWMGEYDHKTKNLTYYSCGHNPPILRRKGGLVEVLAVQDIAMGLDAASDKQAESKSLAEGDLLILYTDGVTEAHNEKLELFGEERLIAFAKRHGDLSARLFADKLIEEVTLFAGKAPQHDDITLLVMKVVE